MKVFHSNIFNDVQKTRSKNYHEKMKRFFLLDLLFSIIILVGWWSQEDNNVD